MRVLLIHHSQTPNGEPAARIPERLRAIHRFHTGPQRAWADVAYNFFVDGTGTIWEGRQGSIKRPVKGDATGGSQGHALLCCFVGDHTTEPPTEAALTAMTALLAWLAHREGLDLAEPVTFTSEGSSRWRRGAKITTEQVAGHRDMSATACPGDALYPLVAGRLLPEARRLLNLSHSSAVPSPTARPSPGGEPPSPAGSGVIAPNVETDSALVRGAAGGVLVASLGALLVNAGRRRGRSHHLDDQHDPADEQGDDQPDQETAQGG